MGYSYRHGRKPGTFTDDTEQALAVARSLVRCRGFSPEDMMAELVQAYRSDPVVYGPTSRRVFDLVLQGMDPRDAALAAHEMNRGSRSNGCVMRGPPIGIWYGGAEVEVYSMACSGLTHYDPVAGACSSFVNRMVSDLCRGGEGWPSACTLPLQGQEVALMLRSFREHDPVPGLDCLLATHASLSVFMEEETFERRWSRP